MSAIIQLFIIAISLAADAFSVSIAGGIKSQKAKLTHAFKVAAFFGTFQAFMPLIGWILGAVMKDFINAVDHWVAFILLGAIGGKMIYESLKNGSEEKKDILDTKTLILLAIATSIDALIVGITLSLLTIPFFTSVAVIGIVTFILCFFGFLFGKRLGSFFGKKVEIVGGVALIAVGLKILIEHLSA